MKSVYRKAVCLKCVVTSRIAFSLNLVPLKAIPLIALFNDFHFVNDTVHA